MTQRRLSGAKGVLFDKDGTLFAFERSGGELGQRLIHELAHGDRTLSQTLADSGGFDLAEGRYTADSLIVAGSWGALAETWAEALPLWRADELELWFKLEATSLAKIGQAPATADLPALLDRLIAKGLALGVATHDAEEAARFQLEGADALDRFAFIAGYDSGFEPKPDRAMLDGFCAATGLPPGEVVVVGDSLADLRMGRAGGALASVGVLSGPADADILAPEADLLLPSICDLPDALER